MIGFEEVHRPSMGQREHNIAAKLIYGKLPHSGALPAYYERAALPVADQQLEQAGIRLAAVLNQALSRP